MHGFSKQQSPDLILAHEPLHTRVVWENATWIKPYWSAAAYVVSQRGAAQLLRRYWPRAPLLSGATIDTRQQLWPAADQLIFNLSSSFMSAPLLTQPTVGTHAEHARFKQDARNFVFHTWLPEWGSLSQTKLVLASIFVIGDSRGDGQEVTAQLHDACATGKQRNTKVSDSLLAWHPCHRMAHLPPHVFVSPAQVANRPPTATASFRQWLLDTHTVLPSDAFVWREPAAPSLRLAARAAAEMLATRLAVESQKAAFTAKGIKQELPSGIGEWPSFVASALPPFTLLLSIGAPTAKRLVPC